jgi:sulfur carrier protein
MKVVVNGTPRELTDGTRLAELVVQLTGASTGTPTGPPTGIAAAVNDTVVPRGAWSATVLAEGDRVEVLTAVQGG